MPQQNFSLSVPANQSVQPLTGWQFRIPQKAAMIELFINATAAGLVFSLTTGSESIVQADTPVSAGGTAGVLPARLNSEPIVDVVLPLDEIVLTVRNTTGAAITVNGVLTMTYQ